MQLSPLVVRLFRPARWCRCQWCYLWFKFVFAAGVLAVLLFVFGACSGWTNKRSWENWLENFRFAGAGSRNPRAKYGAQRDRELRDMEPLPAYLGDGKAELGEYCVHIFDPITQSEMRTEFRLEGTTSYGDEASFHRFMRCNHRFFREQVAVVFRMHNLDELVAPDLNLLGRKIVARVNRSLDQPVLRSAQVKDFGVYESIDRSGFALLDRDEGDGMP